MLNSKAANLLDEDIQDDLKQLYYEVYNEARHVIGTFEIDALMFSPATTQSLFSLDGRVLVSRILPRASGITNGRRHILYSTPNRYSWRQEPLCNRVGVPLLCGTLRPGTSAIVVVALPENSRGQYC